MSLILDALKKSENERQRQGGSAMFEIKVAPPRARFPMWAILLGLLLGVNLVVLVVVMLLREPRPSGSADPAPVVAQPVPAPPSTEPVAPVAPVAPAAEASPASAGRLAAGSPLASRFNPPLVEDPELDAAEAEGTPGSIEMDPVPRELPVAPGPRPGGGVVSGLPDRAALVAAGTQVPEVNVSLHAWDRSPAARFVFINGTRATEGTELPGGVRIEQINPEGTVLSFRGTRFFVPIQ